MQRFSLPRRGDGGPGVLSPPFGLGQKLLTPEEYAHYYYQQQAFQQQFQQQQQALQQQQFSQQQFQQQPFQQQAFQQSLPQGRGIPLDQTSQPDAQPGESTQKACFFYFGHQKNCRNGAQCSFSHDEEVYMQQNNVKKCPNEGCANYCRGRQCKQCHFLTQQQNNMEEQNNIEEEPSL